MIRDDLACLFNGKRHRMILKGAACGWRSTGSRCASLAEEWIFGAVNAAF
jgi:hypothetical protein